MLKQTAKRGFTITELIIVIVVIAILAAVLIPTFANLIKKANLSADQQAVRQMNTILTAEETVSGKPATVVAAKGVLTANGITDFDPMEAANTFYWVGSENRVLLWTKDDGADTGKVVYPKEMQKKYKDLTTPSADWSNLKDEIVAELIEIPDGTTPKDAMIAAIKEAEDGAILQMPKDTQIQMAQGGLHWLGQALKMDGGVGKNVTIDLNGSTLVSSGTNAKYTRTEDGTGFLKDEDGYYVMNILTVPANSEMILCNGKIDIQHGNQPTLAAAIAESGATLIMRDIEMNTTTAGIMPDGDASEVVLENCVINACNYALGTNRMTSSHLRVVISNTEMSVTHSTAVLINTLSDTHIYNSKITGVVHAIALRAGTLEIKDSTLITTDDAPGIYAYDNFAKGYNFQGWWGTGNTIPGGTLVVGDYAKANGDGSFSYSGDAVVTLENTKLQSAASDKVPEILMAASDPAKNVSVTYDAASSVGSAVVYGEVWNPTDDNVGVTINNPGTIKVNGTTK